MAFYIIMYKIRHADGYKVTINAHNPPICTSPHTVKNV